MAVCREALCKRVVDAAGVEIADGDGRAAGATGHCRDEEADCAGAEDQGS